RHIGHDLLVLHGRGVDALGLVRRRAGRRLSRGRGRQNQDWGQSERAGDGAARELDLAHETGDSVARQGDSFFQTPTGLADGFGLEVPYGAGGRFTPDVGGSPAPSYLSWGRL